MSKQLFIIGNKRSGTSLLVQLLNIHPEIFISHESDIIWILYQCRDGLPKHFACYKLDGCAGMIATLEAYSHVINSNVTNELIPSHMERLRNTFFDVESMLKHMGSPIQPSYPDKGELQWVGDKKPTQQCDPLIRPFIYDLFPDVHFIHIVRHPYAVVSSKILYRGRNQPDMVPAFWREDAPTILRYWARHEQWVLDTKQEMSDNVLTVRLEDLAARPEDELKTIASFLDVDVAPFLGQVTLDEVRKNPNEKFMDFVYRTPATAKQMMELYGYGAK